MFWWQVLIQITERYMRGLALQTYTVPGRTQPAKRLYVTAAQKAAGGKASDTTIVRLNLDHLETLENSTKKPVGDNEWHNLTKEIVPPRLPETSFSRLAYARGKIYYMSAGGRPGSISAAVISRAEAPTLPS